VRVGLTTQRPYSIELHPRQPVMLGPAMRSCRKPAQVAAALPRGRGNHPRHESVRRLRPACSHLSAYRDGIAAITGASSDIQLQSRRAAARAALIGSAAAAGVVAIEKAEIAIVSASFAAALVHRAFEVSIVIPTQMSRCGSPARRSIRRDPCNQFALIEP
jgi:hypothetical protein